MKISEYCRIDGLGTEEAAKELSNLTQRSFPRDKFLLLSQMLLLTESCESVNSSVAVGKLRIFIKASLIAENIKSQIAMYGEPVLTVEKVIEQVESDRRFLNPMELADVELVKTFFKGYLIKANSKKSPRRDRCLEVIINKLCEETREEPIEEIPFVPSNFEEIKLPEKFKQYFDMVDLMMKYTLVSLFEFCKKEPSKEYVGPATPVEDAEKCEEPSLKWLRQEIQARLGLVCESRYNVYVQHTSGLVISQPTLYFRENVIDRKRKTICFFGWASDFSRSYPTPAFDKMYTPKRFYNSHVHDLKAPLIAYLTAIKLIKIAHQSFPFNLKMMVFPFRLRDETVMKMVFEDNLPFLENVDRLVLMNGLDYQSPYPAIISSAVGERLYSLAVYLPQQYHESQEDSNQTWERLRIILFELMDLLRQYRYFVKHRKTMEKVDTSSLEFVIKVEFGTAERVRKEVDVNMEIIEMGGWEAAVALKTFTTEKQLIASITEDDFTDIQKLLRTCDPLLRQTYCQLRLVSRCRDWNTGNEYSEELGPILKLALLRGSNMRKLAEARSESVQPMPGLLQKFLRKDTMAISFGGIQEFGHHAISYLQVKEAVKIAVCLIMGLKEHGTVPSEEEINRRTMDVLDVTAVAEIPITTHLESPFYPNDPDILKMFAEFLQVLKPKSKPLPPKLSLVLPLEGNFGNAGMVAKYFSKCHNQWIVVKYAYTDKIQAQRKYIEEAKTILRKKGVCKERDIAYWMVMFLRYLLFKKRRSDVICKNCKVYEIRFPGLPMLSALSRNFEAVEDSSLVAAFQEPQWTPLQDTTYQLVDAEGFVSYRGFMKLVKDLIFNIIFDGETSTPIDKLYQIILQEERKCKNSSIVNAIASTVLRRKSGDIINDKSVLKYSSYFKVIPKYEYNFKKLYNCPFAEDIITLEEIKYYVLTDAVQKFLIKRRLRPELSSSPSSESFVSEKSMSVLQIAGEQQVDEDVKLDESLYKMIDRTLIEKLLKNEVVILPPSRMSVAVVMEEKLPYWRSQNWYTLFNYLLNKSKKATDMYNDMWDLYKHKLRKLGPNEPVRWVFPVEFGNSDETFDTETLHSLKRYVKYSITILEHFIRLNYYLDDLNLLYSIKPTFLNYEAFFIIRDSTPVPSLPPKAPPELIQLTKTPKKTKLLSRDFQSSTSDLKKSSSAEEKKGKEQMDDSSESFQNIWTNFQTLFSSKEVQAQAKKLISPRREAKRQSTGESESSRRRSERHASVNFRGDVRRTPDIRAFVKLRKAFKLLMATHEDVLHLILQTKECWKNGAVNNLREFEEILYMNIYYWKQFKLIDDTKRYYLCRNIYEKTENILKRLSEGTQKPSCGSEFDYNLKDYILADKLDKILPYVRKQRHRNYAIFSYLSEQNSKLCLRPRDYYKKLTECYTAIINMIKTITLLQDRFPEILTLDWIEIIKSNFHFLHDVTAI